MKKLTPRQSQVFTFIKKQIRKDGYPPTLREIGEALGIRSTNGVNDHLKALERKGYIQRDGHRSRSICVLQKDPHAASKKRPQRKIEPRQNEQANVLPALVPMGHSVQIPVLGRVAAGEPILAIEQAEDSVTMDSFFVGDAKRVYALRVVGESMIDDGILDGDFIFVRKQSHAERGAIVVAMIDGEATVKRYFPEKDHVRFQPANPAMQPIIVLRSAFRETQILGTVVSVMRRI